MNQGVLYNIMFIWLFGNFKFYEIVWKYLSGYISYLFLRLYYFKEVVNEEEENWIYGFVYVILVDMEYVECEEDEIQMMYGEEGVEVF